MTPRCLPFSPMPIDPLGRYVGIKWPREMASRASRDKRDNGKRVARKSALIGHTIKWRRDTINKLCCAALKRVCVLFQLLSHILFNGTAIWMEMHVLNGRKNEQKEGQRSRLCARSGSNMSGNPFVSDAVGHVDWLNRYEPAPRRLDNAAIARTIASLLAARLEESAQRSTDDARPATIGEGCSTAADRGAA